jgi:hypothetical protein
MTPLVPAPQVAAAPVAQAQPASSGLNGGEAGLLALLAAGGLAGAGIMVARSRRRSDDEDDTAESVSQGAVITPATPRESEPIIQRVAIPAGQVPAESEREALLQQRVAADPDEANPFTSPRSRRKRARLILQHRAHLRETQGAEPFDWRTYRSTQTASRAKEPPVPA